MLNVNTHSSSFSRIAKNLKVKMQYQSKRKNRLAVMQLNEALGIAEQILKLGATEERIQNLHNACAADEVIKCFGFVNICYE